MERLKKTQKLIHLYRSYECLWNPQSPGYHSSTVKDDAWRRITLHMKSGLTPDQVKLQILGLRNYYSQECSALQRSQQEGYSYVPRHSYFQDLQFLGNLDVEGTNEVSDGAIDRRVTHNYPLIPSPRPVLAWAKSMTSWRMLLF